MASPRRPAISPNHTDIEYNIRTLTDPQLYRYGEAIRRRLSHLTNTLTKEQKKTAEQIVKRIREEHAERERRVEREKIIQTLADITEAATHMTTPSGYGRRITSRRGRTGKRRTGKRRTGKRRTGRSRKRCKVRRFKRI